MDRDREMDEFGRGVQQFIDNIFDAIFDITAVDFRDDISNEELRRYMNELTTEFETYAFLLWNRERLIFFLNLTMDLHVQTRIGRSERLLSWDRRSDPRRRDSDIEKFRRISEEIVSYFETVKLLVVEKILTIYRVTLQRQFIVNRQRG